MPLKIDVINVLAALCFAIDDVPTSQQIKYTPAQIAAVKNLLAALNQTVVAFEQGEPFTSKFSNT